MSGQFEHDAVIIGSGPNGLSAAVALAQAGHDVLVIEAQEEIGGGVRSQPLTVEGFTHDVCSAIHPLTIGSPFLSTLPLQQHGVEWVHPAAPLAHPLDDGPAAVLDRSFDTASGDWRRRLQPLARGWNELAHELLQPPLHVPRHVGALAGFGLAAIRSASGASRGWFSDPAEGALFAGLAAHSMLPLERAGSAAFGLVLGAAAHAVGWPFPRGGAQRIADALASLLRGLGGGVETGRSIARLSELPAARVYLFDTSPHAMVAIAGDALPPRYGRAIAGYRYGMGIFKLDWALHQPIPWRDERCGLAGTVHLGGTIDEIAQSERDAWEGRICERPFVLLAQHTLFDASRAPAGKHTAWGYCHVPHGSTEDMTARIEAQIERFAPGFHDCVIARHVMNAARIEAYNPNCIGGDINGGAATLRQLLFRPAMRLNPYATPNPRIFLCSASTPPGGGVHGMCGYHAARTAMRRVLRGNRPG